MAVRGGLHANSEVPARCVKTQPFEGLEPGPNRTVQPNEGVCKATCVSAGWMDARLEGMVVVDREREFERHWLHHRVLLLDRPRRFRPPEFCPPSATLIS